VLTGGASSRMGADKALLALHGHPLATIAAAALVEAGAREVFTVGGDRAGLRAAGLDARADDHPGQGPLGGLLTALRLAGQPVVVVLSCDMPVIDGPTVALLVGALARDPEAQVAAPVIDGLVQGITAAYRGDAAPVLAQAFHGGERAVRRAIRGLRLAPVLGVDPARLVDVDRPDDLRRYAAPS